MTKKEKVTLVFNWTRNIIIQVPMIVFFTFVFGAVYSNTFVNKIPMVIVDHDNSSTSRTIIKQFDESQGFKITEYANSDSEMQELILRKEVSAGLVIPKSFGKNISEQDAPKTLFVVDGTNLVVGNNAFAYGSEILNTLNAGVQLKVLEAKGMVPYEAMKTLTSMNFVQRTVYDPQMSYMKYLMFGIIGIMIQQTILSVLAPMLIEDKRKMMGIKLRSKAGIKWIGRLVAQITMVTMLAIIGFTSCFYVIGKYYNLPLRGTVLNNLILLLIFIVDIIAVCFVLAAIFRQILPCVQLCMFLSVPSILTCGYVWPAFMMPTGLIEKVNLVWPIGAFINPLRAINIKGTDYQGILPYIKSGLLYAAIWIPIGIGFYIFRIYIDKVIQKKKAELKRGQTPGVICKI
ncbi:ABC transporter permease [Clostridium sp.]|jgi:ABC-2 type transport system permease protein|uniref:ABC transporter permease n=1 Tax=Clostridium sp. TaxID=1506 RepID=UPI003EEDCC4A